MDKLTIILIVLSAVLAVATAYFQYFFKTKEKSQYLYWLSFFRAATLFCLLLLLINPSIKKVSFKMVKPQLHIVVDNTKSIAFRKNDSKITNALEQIQSSPALSDKFDLNYYTFGTKVEALDSLNFSEDYTDIDKVFRTFAQITNEAQQAIVLITDGNETTGSTTYKSNGNRTIYPLIVGDTAQYEDLSIDRLNVNPTTFLNNNAPVEVFVNYSGRNPISKELSIYRERQKITSQVIELDKVQNSRSVSFMIPAKEAGRHFYSARIENLENEKNTENNIRSFALNVIKEQAKILVLSEVVHPDLGMLKASIGSKTEREVTVSSVDDISDLSGFDLVILYQPTPAFGNVMKMLEAKEMNYFLISGMVTDWSFLNRVQSNFNRQSIASEEDFSVVFNEDFSTFLTEPLRVDKWPPVQHTYGKLKLNIPFNTLLFQSISGIKTKEPILGTFEIGQQKVGLLLGENIWRWRMYSYKETGSFDEFDTFFSNLIQYLSSKKQKNRLNISLKELYFANEMVEFTASYLDDNLNFDPKALLEVSILKTDGSFERSVPFTAYASTFKAAFSNLSEGTYNYSVKVLNENISKSGSFKVASYNLEEQLKTSKWNKLEMIASETGGEVYFERDAEKLIEDLVENPAFRTVQKSSEENIPLIEWKLLLLAILISLGLEWFTRKYFGKI